MKQKKEEKNNKGFKLDIRALLLMDDCLADNANWKKDDELRKIFMNGRHYYLTYILTMQYPLGIGPDLRTNIDYVILLADNNIDNQMRMYKSFCGIFPSFYAFKEVFLKLTDDYGCMIIDNKCKSNNIVDVVYWYKAPFREWNTKLKCGDPQFYHLHEDNYNENWMNDNNVVTNNNIVKILKNKSNINIEKI
jgi:hypothetical protein